MSSTVFVIPPEEHPKLRCRCGQSARALHLPVDEVPDDKKPLCARLDRNDDPESYAYTWGNWRTTGTYDYYIVMEFCSTKCLYGPTPLRVLDREGMKRLFDALGKGRGTLEVPVVYEGETNTIKNCIYTVIPSEFRADGL